MGDVLVRKARIQPQFSQGGFQFPIEVGGKRGGKNITFTNPTGLERTPRAAAAAKEEGVKARGELARLPRTASLPADEREKNRTERATMQGLIEDAGPRSLEEKIGVKSFNRLADYEKYNPTLRDRAAARAGRVGVRGAKLGRGISSGLGLGLGILSGAAALSDASAAGQDFGGALAGAGLTGVSTGTSVMEHSAPLLQGLGARVGGRLGSASVTVPHRAMNRMDNKPTMLARGIENIRNRVTKPVAVTPPTVAQPTPTITRPMRPTAQQKTQSQQKATMGIYGQDPKGAPAQLGHFGPFADKHLQYQQEEAMNMIGVASPTSRNYNPTAYQDLQPKPPVHVVPGSGGQTTITGQPAPVAAPVNQPQVGVQSTLNVGEAASAFNKPPEGSVEAMKETGAAGKQAAADFMGTGSMASQSMAGNQPKPEEEEEEEEEQ